MICNQSKEKPVEARLKLCNREEKLSGVDSCINLGVEFSKDCSRDMCMINPIDNESPRSEVAIDINRTDVLKIDTLKSVVRRISMAKGQYVIEELELELEVLYMRAAKDIPGVFDLGAFDAHE